MDPNGIDPDLWAKIKLHPLPGVEVGEGYIANVFPDLAITLRSNVVSIDAQQIHGPTRVSLENRTLGLADDPEAPGVIDDAVDELLEAVLVRGGDVVAVPDGALAHHGRLVLAVRGRTHALAG